MKLCDFEKLKTIADFANQKTLTHDNWSELYPFYKNVYNKHVSALFESYPLYNTLTKSNKYRYIIVEVGDDRVLVVYKVIHILKTHQIRTVNEPISIKNNKKNEFTIIGKLKKLPFVKMLFNETCKKLVRSEKTEIYNDYFYDFSKRDYMDKSKFRSKRGLNKLEADDKFSVNVYHSLPYNKISHLREQWIIGMEKFLGHKVAPTSTKNLINIVETGHDDLIILTLEYDGMIVNVQVMLKTDFGYAYSLYINHMGRTAKQFRDNHNLYILLSNMQDIQNYYTRKILSEYGIDYLYIAGARPTEKRLLAHKETVTDGVLKYFTDNCNFDSKYSEPKKKVNRLF